MRNLIAISIFLALFAVICFVGKAIADPTDRSLEYILNRCFDSSTNTLRIVNV